MISLTRINGQILEPLFHSLVYQLVYICHFTIVYYSQNLSKCWTSPTLKHTIRHPCLCVFTESGQALVPLAVALPGQAGWEIVR